MSELARALGAALAAGRTEPELLARLGEPDPAAAAAAFGRLLALPPLKERAAWLGAELARGASPGAGAAALADLALHRPDIGLLLDRAPLLPRVVAASRALARTLLRRPDLADELAGTPPPPPHARPGEPLPVDFEAIREHKYRGLLRIAARDLGGRDFRRGMEELSELADACLCGALAAVCGEARVEPPALFALGKLGGRELNFSSDVDVLFIYAADSPEIDLARNRELEPVIRAFRSRLEERSALGFGYRVDLDLRPEGRQGALANSVQAALTYYESFGQEWERQAMIRLRHVAGPEEPARAFQEAVAPFVWRRALDPRVLERVSDMKARIERERRDAGRDLGRELKEGPGGIRDVEFLVQALQLLLGGRDPSLRSGNVLDALAALARARALPEEAAADLSDAYLWLRRAEHALQMDEERQTHLLPRSPTALAALARRMGYPQETAAEARDALLGDHEAVRARVRRRFHELVIREAEEE